MSPYSKHFNLEKAENFLTFAIQFTPQYGDSFIELLRLYLLQNQKEKIKKLKSQCINYEPNYGVVWFYCKESMIDTSL